MSASDRKQKINELKAQLDALYKEDEKEANLKIANEYLIKAFHKIMECNISSPLEIQQIIEKAAKSSLDTDKKMFVPCPAPTENKEDNIQFEPIWNRHNVTERTDWRVYTCSRHPLNTHPNNWSFDPSECPNCECPRTAH
jgi:hypothetical protein